MSFTFPPVFVDVLVRALPAPAPSPSMVTPPDDLVTPGFGGFAVIALLVVAVFALVWDMQRRVRRARYRSEIDAELDAEQAARDAESPAGDDPDAGSPPTAGGAATRGPENRAPGD